MNTIRTILAAVARQLRVAADISSVFEHNGMIGESREALFRDGLRLLTPGHVDVVHSAKIVNARGEKSYECDLLLKGRSWPAFFSSDRKAVVPAELVFGIIEISSDLWAEKLREDCAKIRAAKQVQKTAFTGSDVRYRTAYGRQHHYVPTVGMLFAYGGARLETLGVALAAWCRDKNVPVEQRAMSHPLWKLSGGIVAHAAAATAL